MTNIYDSIREDEKKLEEEFKTLKGESDGENNEDEIEEADVGDDVDEGREGDGEPEGDEAGEEEPESGGKGKREETSQGSEGEKDSLLKPKEDKEAVSFARLRWEKDAAERRAKELAEELAAVRNPPKQSVDADPEPNKQEAYEAWLEWKDRQIEAKVNKLDKFVTEQAKKEEVTNTFKAAIDELNEYNVAYSKANPDFKNAMDYGYQTYFKALKVTNPGASEAQIVKMIDNTILNFAAEAVRNGKNPSEEFHSYIVNELGYTGKQSETVKEIRKAVPMKTIEGNKRKSASALQGGGQEGASRVSLEGTKNMSVGEFSRLSAAELDALEQEAYAGG